MHDVDAVIVSNGERILAHHVFVVVILYVLQMIGFARGVGRELPVR